MKFRPVRSASKRQAILAAALAAAMGAADAAAQTEVAPERRDLPPVSAPTDKISVAPIPVVRSESEVAGDFGTGLVKGLIASGKVRGAVLVAVREDHVIVAQAFGAAVSAATLIDATITARVLDNDTKFDGEVRTPDDAGRFLFALANAESPVDTQSVQPAVNPTLPGHSDRFDEMRRNGWSALARDWESGGMQSRLVLVPEAKLAYFISFAGHPVASVWRAADDALFDKMLAPRDAGESPAPSEAPPSPRDAGRAAGIYEPVPDGITFLKTAGEWLRVAARADGALVLSGADDDVLLPRAGGYWGADNGNLNAVLRDGELLLSAGAYRPLAYWKRPNLYALLALLAAFSSAGAALHARRNARAIVGDLVLCAGGLALGLLMFAALAWFLAPGP